MLEHSKDGSTRHDRVLIEWFCLQVVSPPYKINTLVTFSSRVLSTPPNILKDFIKIMKMELVSADCLMLQVLSVVSLKWRLPQVLSIGSLRRDCL